MSQAIPWNNVFVNHSVTETLEKNIVKEKVKEINRWQKEQQIMRMGACEFGTITAPQTTPNAVFVWGLGNLSCLSNSPSAEAEDSVVS